MTTKRDGYRYVRQYTVRDGLQQRWALWEIRAGRRTRVGTAHSEEQYRNFLKGENTCEETIS